MKIEAWLSLVYNNIWSYFFLFLFFFSSFSFSLFLYLHLYTLTVGHNRWLQQETSRHEKWMRVHWNRADWIGNGKLEKWDSEREETLIVFRLLHLATKRTFAFNVDRMWSLGLIYKRGMEGKGNKSIINKRGSTSQILRSVLGKREYEPENRKRSERSRNFRIVSY